MKPQRILVTGSEGLVGSVLCARLRAVGHEVLGLDLRAADDGARIDVCDTERLRPIVESRDGIVHLAAVSRVVVAEHEPDRCWQTNVNALRELLDLAVTSRTRPWFVFVSSREVYGQPATLPATENAPFAPVNIYGRSKVAGEQLCEGARAAGLTTAVVRLSNVFGSATDHADRVVPAFVRGALAGEPLRVDGSANTFDFTHVDDAVAGLVAVATVVAADRTRLPPLHFVSGVPTTLGELASAVIRLTGSRAGTLEAPARVFDVARFIGDPSRARSLLGWRPEVPLEDGLHRLVDAFRLRAAHLALPIGHAS